MTQQNNPTKEELLNALAGRIRLDFRGDDPIYLQIARQVEALVKDGGLRPGDQLPTVREMAVDLRINFSTVARAYRILDEERLISTQRGRGTYIEEPPVPGGTRVEEREASSSPEVLVDLAKSFIREAAQSGASLEQIEWAFRQELEAWQRNHPTGSGHHFGG